MGAAVFLQGFGPLRGLLPDALPWPGGTCAELRRAVRGACPHAADWIASSLAFAGGAFLREDEFVAAGATVQLLPPVSGG